MQDVQGLLRTVSQNGAFEGVCGRLRGEYYRTGVRKPRRDMPPLFGIVEFIHAASIGVSTSCWRGILSITPQQEPEVVDHPRKKLKLSKEKIAFDDDDFKEMT